MVSDSSAGGSNPLTDEKTPFDPRCCELATAYSQPLYERLRYRDAVGECQFLGFVRSVSYSLRQVLFDSGARPTSRLEAACYAEVWVLSHEWIAKPPVSLLELELMIATDLSRQVGGFSPATGYWFHPPASAETPTSRLIELSDRCTTDSHGTDITRG